MLLEKFRGIDEKRKYKKIKPSLNVSSISIDFLSSLCCAKVADAQDKC